MDELDIQQVKQCINGKIGPDFNTTTSDDDENNDDNDNESIVQYEPTHHYVIVGKEKLKDRGTMWIQQKKWISDMRNNTKCIICGNSDKKCPPTHIPIQCTAGEDGEHRSFRKHHTKEVNKYGCQQAMHVGCALWGDKTPYKYNRLQMDPGFGGDNSEPMLELCKLFTYFCSFFLSICSLYIPIRYVRFIVPDSQQYSTHSIIRFASNHFALLYLTLPHFTLLSTDANTYYHD